ncbi:hypothetical protein GCM10029992_03790 [Glycomyces albus]
MTVRVQPSAQVDQSARIGDGSSVWDLAQIREDAVLGTGCIVGRGAYVGTGVVMGDNVKLQNYALVYEPARLGDGVFVGPAAVFTNDHNPRSVDPHGGLKRAGDWEAVGVIVEEEPPSAPGPCAWRRSGSDGGRWSPPGPWSPRTSPRTPWSWASRPEGSAGSAGAASAWSRPGRASGSVRAVVSAISSERNRSHTNDLSADSCAEGEFPVNS